MKNLFLLILIAFSSVIFGQAIPHGVYKLFAIQNIGSKSVDSTYRNENLSVDFKSDTALTWFLNKNSCGGSYYVMHNKISIIPTGCTKMCCDNESSKFFSLVLQKTEFFSISGDHLTLTGREGILFFRKKG